MNQPMKCPESSISAGWHSFSVWGDSIGYFETYRSKFTQCTYLVLKTVYGSLL